MSLYESGNLDNYGIIITVIHIVCMENRYTGITTFPSTHSQKEIFRVIDGNSAKFLRYKKSDNFSSGMQQSWLLMHSHSLVVCSIGGGAQCQ